VVVSAESIILSDMMGQKYHGSMLSQDVRRLCLPTVAILRVSTSVHRRGTRLLPNHLETSLFALSWPMEWFVLLGCTASPPFFLFRVHYKESVKCNSHILDLDLLSPVQVLSPLQLFENTSCSRYTQCLADCTIPVASYSITSPKSFTNTRDEFINVISSRKARRAYPPNTPTKRP
jgi:hypothetical protein